MADTSSTGTTTPTVDQATPTDKTTPQGTEESVQLAQAAAVVQVSAPARGAEASLTVEPGQTVELQDPAIRFTQKGADLVIHWDNTAHTTLVDALAAGTPLILADGTALSFEQLLAMIPDLDPGALAPAAVAPAAGPPVGRAAGGAFNEPFDGGTLGPEHGIKALLLGTELQFGLIEGEPDLIPAEGLVLTLNFVTEIDEAVILGGFEDWQRDQNVGDFTETPMRLDISGSGPIASVVISGIPFDVAVFIGDPFGTAEPAPGSGTYSVTVDAADLDSIYFLPPDDSDVDFSVTVTATGVNGALATAGVTAVVDAAADLPDIGFSGDGEGGVFNVTYNEDNAVQANVEEVCFDDNAPIFGAGFTAAVTDTDGSERIKEIVVRVPLETTGDPDLPDNPVDPLGLRFPLSGVDEQTATNFLIGGVVVTEGATVQVQATFIDAAGVLQSGLVNATATFGVDAGGNATMTLSFDPFDPHFQVQSVDLSGTSSTNFEVRLPQHSDDDFRLQLDVTVTENPPTDGELILTNNEATQTSFLNVEVQAVADRAAIDFTPQVFDFVEDDEHDIPDHGFDDGTGTGNVETPLRIPLTFVARLTDTDGSESVTRIVVDLNGADPGAKFVLANGDALGSTVVIDGVTFAVSITAQTLTLTADPPGQAPGQDIDMAGGVGGVVFIELPIDDSTDFSADVSVTTTETNPEGAVADETCTVTETMNFTIEGVVGPADAGFLYPPAAFDGEGVPLTGVLDVQFGTDNANEGSPTRTTTIVLAEDFEHNVPNHGDDGLTSTGVPARGYQWQAERQP